MDIKSRLKQIEELDSFISSKQKILNSVLDSLGWTEDSLKDEIKVRCPINPGHWIPESSMSHHKDICEWVKDGYTKEELEKQPPDSKFFYEKSSNVISVKIDQPTHEKILSESGLNSGSSSKTFPKTVDRWISEFHPEQRLAAYDFIINASKSAEKPKNVTLEDLMIDFEKKDEQDDKPKSQLEILAEMRDYKRRRQSYRAKNVHITKKSYTEIMKEVIENQTSYLVETRKFEDSEEKDYGDSDDKKRKHSYDTNSYDASEDASFKSRYQYSEHRRDDDSRKHHSRHKSSKHYSPKRKKHKKDRSRSRSRSRSPSHHKHKKSHKQKRSYD